MSSSRYALASSSVMVEVSAKKRINLDQLLEMILLVAEVANLRANPTRPGIGAVLEALTQGRHLIMAQRYLPAIAEGDKRIVLVDGVVAAKFLQSITSLLESPLRLVL